MKNFKRNLIGQSIASIVQAFRAVQKGQEVRDKDLYYKVTLAAAGGNAKISLFHENSGTYATTNIEENGKMPVGKHFLIEAVAVTPVGQAAVEANRVLDVNEVAADGYLVVEIDNTEVGRYGPIRKLIPSLAMTGIDATSGDMGYEPFVLANPILLEGGKTFKIRLEFTGNTPATTADVVATVELLGQEISE